MEGQCIFLKCQEEIELFALKTLNMAVFVANLVDLKNYYEGMSL